MPPVVITVAARKWPDLPKLTEGGSIGSGTPVQLPKGLSGEVLAIGPPYKSAASPDELHAVIQFVVDSAGPFIRDLFVGVLGAWLYDRISGRVGGKKIEVRVFIGHLEVDPSDPGQIAEAIARQLDEGSPRSLPPQLSPRPVNRPGIADDEWVEEQLELSRRHHEGLARQMDGAEADDRVRKLRKTHPWSYSGGDEAPEVAATLDRSGGRSRSPRHGRPPSG
jgi:hypothetical protein